METQSVIIPKNQFTKSKADKWIKDNGYKLSFYKKKMEETDNFYRYRQMAPSKFDKKSFRNKKLPDGIELVLGKLK